jgi:hypothetical protein
VPFRVILVINRLFRLIMVISVFLTNVHISLKAKLKKKLKKDISNFTNNMLHLSNKEASVSSDILVGHMTSSQNESGLSKYMMVHE